MKSINRTCALTGAFLGTHGPAVKLVGGPAGTSQHLSPEICGSLINVIGREEMVSSGLYSAANGTFDIGGLKAGKAGKVDDVSRNIYAKFRTHQRVTRFLMENLGVSHDKLSLWKEELEQSRQPEVSVTRASGRRAMHFH